MKTTMKPNQKSTFHRDGTISYWSVSNQTWSRGIPSWDDIQSMPMQERMKTISHLVDHPQATEGKWLW